MKCPICGAASRVLETRTTDTHATRRTRECDNLHRFETFEIVGPAVNPGALARADRTVEARRARWERDRQIRMAAGTIDQIAAQFGVGRDTVKDARHAGGRRRAGVKR